MCGILGVYLKNPDKDSSLVPQVIYQGLKELQHRGQKSAGMMTAKGFSREGETILNIHKDLGSVETVFDDSFFQTELPRMNGTAGIAQVRYSTSGKRNDRAGELEEAQPFMRKHSLTTKYFGIVFNGNLANNEDLRAKQKERGYALETMVDTETLKNLIVSELKDRSQNYTPETLFSVMQGVYSQIDGSANILFLNARGEMLASRDKHGFNNLVYGETPQMYVFASETCSLKHLGIKKFTEIEPGQSVLVTRDGLSSKQLLEPDRKECHFRIVYFERSDSIVQGEQIRKKRAKLGEELARLWVAKHGFENRNYLVVPAPMTAIPAAEKFASALKFPLSIAIIKKNAKRGFINDELERALIMHNGYIFYDHMEGMNIILPDDSLIRGETSKVLVQGCRDAGANEVHVLLTEPPVNGPCFYGMDMKTVDELPAAKHDNLDIAGLEKAIAEEIGADSVLFNTEEGLLRGLGIPKHQLCIACTNRQYPTPCGQMRFNLQLANRRK